MATMATAVEKENEQTSTMAAAARVEPDLVMNYRGGSVLGKKTILKSDHFPGCQNKRLLPQIDGAPNYRQVKKRKERKGLLVLFALILSTFG